MVIHSVFRFRNSNNEPIYLRSSYSHPSKPKYVIESIHQIVHSDYVRGREPHTIATRLITTEAHDNTTTFWECDEFSKDDVLKNDSSTAVSEARLYCDRTTAYTICADTSTSAVSWCYDIGVLPVNHPEPNRGVNLYVRVKNVHDDMPEWDNIDWDYYGHIDAAYDTYC